MADRTKQHVFVVDDELEVRRIIGETLEHVGLSVERFSNGLDCLERLASQRCDLLIADLKMPQMCGLELLRRAKTVAPWLPVLIVTGYGDIPTAVEATKIGAADFIEKPLDKQSFVLKVNSLLSGNGNHRPTNNPLTRCEQTVLQHVLAGKSNREIASLLNRSQRTIEVHRAHAMQKLGVDGLVDLVKRAAEMGLV